jgi:hypothetical protein
VTDRLTNQDLRYLIERAEDRRGANMTLPASTVSRIANQLMDARMRIAELEAQFDRVRKVHQPIEALNVRYPGGRRTQVCSGCGTDAGNWQMYPCPTIRALNGPRPAPESREVQS